MRLHVLKTNENITSEVEKAIKKEEIVLIPSDIKIPEEIKEEFGVVKEGIKKYTDGDVKEFNVVYDKNKWVYYKPACLSSKAGEVYFTGKTVTFYKGHYQYEAYLKDKAFVLDIFGLLLKKDEYERIKSGRHITTVLPDIYYSFNNYNKFINDYGKRIDLKLRVSDNTLIVDNEGNIILKFADYHSGNFNGNKNTRFEYTDGYDIFVNVSIDSGKELIGGYRLINNIIRYEDKSKISLVLPGVIAEYDNNIKINTVDNNTEIIIDLSYGRGKRKNKLILTYIDIKNNNLFQSVWNKNIKIHPTKGDVFNKINIKDIEFISFTNTVKRTLKRLSSVKIESMMLKHYGKTFKKSNLELRYVALVTLRTHEPYIYAELEYSGKTYSYHIGIEEITKFKDENAVARFILKNILNKIKIEKNKIKIIEKAKELSEKDGSELLELVHKVSKFTITDSLAIGNCEFGTKRWVEEIGLDVDKAVSISGQELAKILSQHPDHLKDRNFIKVLAYKLM